MRYCLTSILATLLMGFSGSASAHEFWMSASPFSPRVGSQAQLFMYVGEYFEGVQVGYVTSHAAALRHYAGNKVNNLMGLVPTGEAIGQIPLDIASAGTHLMAFDSHPAQITLPADKFQAYLHDEGLDHLIAQREKAGTANEPGRERFRRTTKTLLRAGGKSDQTYAIRTGQRLELVPLNDPLSRPPGEKLRFQLFFDGKPVVKALLRAWHHNGDQTVSIRAITDANGTALFTLPYAGPWMISTLHMIPVTDSADVDWDSFWGNLMFEVPGRK